MANLFYFMTQPNSRFCFAPRSGGASPWRKNERRDFSMSCFAKRACQINFICDYSELGQALVPDLFSAIYLHAFYCTWAAIDFHSKK